jgi:hypothetical protein
MKSFMCVIAWQNLIRLWYQMYDVGKVKSGDELSL